MRNDAADLPVDGTIHEALGIRTVEATADRVILEMEVGPRVHQPFGQLHGGASAVLAESAASIGAYLSADPGRKLGLGIELNISHLRSMRSGILRATATPLRRGRGIHVWQVELADENGEPVAAARCTIAIREG
jgi:1,4-dihydroxy-2-naphthoyl-CoA hydrolase